MLERSCQLGQEPRCLQEQQAPFHSHQNVLQPGCKTSSIRGQLTREETFKKLPPRKIAICFCGSPADHPEREAGILSAVFLLAL
ncbi:hypothetical protein HDV62DRAFT_354961 [Trichoderma sp. SZMC 28011]